ncbi:hypothetical protein SCHPADRAFT_941209 [Schizopora paradoxa]|uniref:Uncharacterized protein n=1 Tax=Schizopora paradoxa TaxID=27342 RepID=A0A0H2RKR8_9AGAM|nr:hypothetical protein SCHPADRAFT_941209 [Schizopora paradoxa]
MDFNAPDRPFNKGNDALRQGSDSKATVGSENSSLRDEVADLKAKLATFETRQLEILEEFKKQEKRHADERKIDRNEFDEKVSSLTSQLERAQGFTSMVVDHYAPDFDVTAEKRLHGVRTCLANGFKTLFPDKFTRKPRDICEAFDPALKILEWNPFQNKLAEHFWLLTSSNSDKTAIYQLRSIFDLCDRNSLLEFQNSTRKYDFYNLQRGEESTLPPPNSKIFEKIFIGHLDNDALKPRGLSGDDFTRFQLRAYLPLLIWAYVEMKTMMQPALQDFYSLARSINYYAHYLTKSDWEPHIVPPFPPMNDSASRFDLGVGLEIRRGQYCKEYLGVATDELQEGWKDETKNEVGYRDNQALADEQTYEVTESVDSSTERKKEIFDSQSEENHSHSTSSDEAYHDAQAALDRASEAITPAYRRLQPYLEKINPICKCLTVILDANLLNLAVYGSLFLRENQEKLIRREVVAGNAIDAGIDSALNRIRDVIEVQKAKKKLFELLDKEDYFTMKEFPVEEAIDEYLGKVLKEVEETPELRNTKTDLYVLFSWLEAAFPDVQK